MIACWSQYERIEEKYIQLYKSIIYIGTCVVHYYFCNLCLMSCDLLLHSVLISAIYTSIGNKNMYLLLITVKCYTPVHRIWKGRIRLLKTLLKKYANKKNKKSFSDHKCCVTHEQNLSKDFNTDCLWNFILSSRYLFWIHFF